MALKETFRERMFVGLITAFLIFMALLALYPVFNTAAISLSSSFFVDRGKVYLWPRGITLSSWNVVVKSALLWRSLANTVFVACVGSVFSLMFTAIMAYPLAHRKFRLRKLIMILVVITMVFRYPIIPYFLTVRSYGLMNKLSVLIVTHLLVAYNLVIMRTFFMQLPEELEEAAVIEGANHFQIFTKITLPLSKPVLATLGLFFAVTYWNLFLHPMLFLQKAELFTLQPRIRAMLSTIEDEAQNLPFVVDFSPPTVKAATILFGTIPILLVYPFLQKYFVKGALLGSLKG